MKTMTILAVALLSSTKLLAPTFAHAASPDSLGVWEGSGTSSDVGSKDQNAFSIVMTRKSLSGGKVRADGKVTLASGQEFTFWQEFEDQGASGFRLVSNSGSGGGQCFTNGMCQSYEQRADGHAFATTIAKDGPDKLRVLVTELEHGKAIRFFQQSLSKKP